MISDHIRIDKGKTQKKKTKRIINITLVKGVQ